MLASSREDPSAALAQLMAAAAAAPFVSAHAFAHSNEEMLIATSALSVLALPSTLNLRGALNPSSPPWPMGGFPILRGPFVISGDPFPPPGASTVLDFHALTNLVVLVEGVSAEVRNLVLLNTCYMAGLVNPELNLTVTSALLNWQLSKAWWVSLQFAMAGAGREGKPSGRAG